MNDIESIVVLKDAASAAIYGAQSGAGGVVLVNQKRNKVPFVDLWRHFWYSSGYQFDRTTECEQQIEMRKISHQNAGLSLPVGWDVLPKIHG